LDCKAPQSADAAQDGANHRALRRGRVRVKLGLGARDSCYLIGRGTFIGL